MRTLSEYIKRVIVEEKIPVEDPILSVDDKPAPTPEPVQEAVDPLTKAIEQGDADKVLELIDIHSPDQLSSYVDMVINKEKHDHFEQAMEFGTPEQKVSLISKMHETGTPAEILVAQHKNAPSHVVAKALSCPLTRHKIAALAHPNAPAEALREYADKHEQFHGAVSVNPNSPPDVLEKLSKSKYQHVLENVASNKNTPDPVLSDMSKKYRKHPIGDLASKNLGKRK